MILLPLVLLSAALVAYGITELWRADQLVDELIQPPRPARIPAQRSPSPALIDLKGQTR